ncbi:uncharacterized protein LOC144445007 [Glandiceps talaboti]
MIYQRILLQNSRSILARVSQLENLSTTKHVISVQRRHISDSLLHIHPSVSSALSAGKPVVALESTIITHGLPYPHNLSTAQLVESVVRDNNATPATIAILDGKIHVGLTNEQLERISSSKDSVKVSRRDFAPVLARSQLGGTTVAATMVIAHKVGIPVFVTGGIGGVHRGAETTMDVSADLTELGRTPVAVVSAGVKSILDIGLTLEYLETEGVTIATYGETKDFPAFFTSKSAHKAPYNVQSPQEAAQMIAKSLSLNLQSGVLIAVPIPEEEAPAGEAIEDSIQQALIEAKRDNIQGKEVTPYVLQRVMELTQGKSLAANLILIKNNAKVGSQIACELARIQTEHTDNCTLQPHTSSRPKRNTSKTSSTQQSRPVIIGASIVDFMAALSNKNVVYHGMTNPGILKQTYGGVARNLADCMSRLGESPLFISAVGVDDHADNLINYCKHMDTSCIQRLPGQQTATYCVVLESSGECLLGIGDTDIPLQMTPDFIRQFEKEISSAPLVCMDANIPAETIQYVCELCHHYGIPVWFEPTCVNKSKKPFQSDIWKTISYVSPNISELKSMYSMLEESPDINVIGNSIEELLPLCRKLLEHIDCLALTLGRDGVLVCRNTHANEPFHIGKLPSTKNTGLVSAVHYPALSTNGITSVSGAGDCLASCIIHGILRGYTPSNCIQGGLKAASLSLHSHHAVPASIVPEEFTLEKITKWGQKLQNPVVYQSSNL